MRILPIIILLVLLFPCVASADTLYVNTSGWYRSGATFNTTGTPIQHAVNNANSYDTIYIWNGSYTENIDISTAHISIEGEGQSVVTVTAAVSSDYVFDVSANYTNITQINATGANVYAGVYASGVYINSVNNCTITHNILSNNTYGIKLLSANNNTIADNTANSNMWTGIWLYLGANNTFLNNTANSNTLDGIYAIECSYCTYTNNTANSNAMDGFYAGGSPYCTYTNNTMNLNGADGLVIVTSSYSTLTGNTMNNNTMGLGIGYTTNNIYCTSNTIQHNSNWGCKIMGSKNNTFESQICEDNGPYDYCLTDSSTNNTLLDCVVTELNTLFNDSTSEWIVKYTTSNITEFSDTTINQTISPTDVATHMLPSIGSITMTTLDDFHAATEVGTAELQLVEFNSGGDSEFVVASDNTSCVVTYELGTFAPGTPVQLCADRVRTNTKIADSSGIATFKYMGGFSNITFTSGVSINVTLNDSTNYTYTVESYNNTACTATIDIGWNGNGTACAVSAEMPLITDASYTALSYTLTNTSQFVVTNVSGVAYCNFTVTGNTTAHISKSEDITPLGIPLAISSIFITITTIIYLRRRSR